MSAQDFKRVEKLFSRRSPLLGLVNPVSVGIVESAMGREVEYCVAELMAERDGSAPATTFQLLYERR